MGSNPIPATQITKIMANASHAKKKRNKQHDVRGTSLVRAGQAIRKAAEEMFPQGSDGRTILLIVATHLEQEGKATRKMR